MFVSSAIDMSVFNELPPELQQEARMGIRRGVYGRGAALPAVARSGSNGAPASRSNDVNRATAIQSLEFGDGGRDIEYSILPPGKLW